MWEMQNHTADRKWVEKNDTYVDHRIRNQQAGLDINSESLAPGQ